MGARALTILPGKGVGHSALRFSRRRLGTTGGELFAYLLLKKAGAHAVDHNGKEEAAFPPSAEADGPRAA